jgi:hypothetical protein
MVPPGGPCRAFIGQADLEVHRRPRAVDSASSHVMANVGVAALVLLSRSLRPSVNRRTVARSIPFTPLAQARNCQLHIRRSCAPILTGSRSELSDTLGRAATGHAQLSK